MNKIFKVYELKSTYAVIKCPHCSNEFRFDFSRKIFGRIPKTVKCFFCGKVAEVIPNCLDEDNIRKHWASAIMIKPNGKAFFLKTDNKYEPIDIKTGDKYE